MIWIWIVAAVVISLLFCEKKLNWQHYIWVLLPIEMYGISVAGATLKPYMIFGIVIILYNTFKIKNIILPNTVVVMIFLLIISNVINGLIVASIMQHLMFIFILVIAYNYLLSQDRKIDFDAISKVTIATTIGYGLVFTIAYIAATNNIGALVVDTMDRLSDGMVMKVALTGAENVEALRLRGFCIDPNTVITTLIPGAAFGLANIFYKNKNMFKSALAVIFFFLVVIFSGSRMALVSFFAMIVIMFVIGYKQAENKRSWMAVWSIALSLLFLFIIANRDSIVSGVISDIEYLFSSRASLTDDAGRFTIWKNNFNSLVENNRLLIGVGQNQILNYVSSSKACHNTWLEWICGTGIIIGTFITLFFVFAPVPFTRKSKQTGQLHKLDVLPIVLAYIIVILAITTVDNITNSVLLFYAILFRYGIPIRASGKGARLK